MNRLKVDYDRLASGYDRRFTANPMVGVEAGLQGLCKQLGAKRVLEVGCGTGHWLARLGPLGVEASGVDLSHGMLRQAAVRHAGLRLAQGRAESLPWARGAFDLVFCVNAVHHFDDRTAFLKEAFQLLRSGGALAIAAGIPHGRREEWYVYRYFPETYTADLERFPTWGELFEGLIALGAVLLTWEVVERVESVYTGREVLADPFLEKEYTSQLALLTAEAYAAGRERLEAAIAAGERTGKPTLFPAHFSMALLVAYRE